MPVRICAEIGGTRGQRRNCERSAVEAAVYVCTYGGTKILARAIYCSCIASAARSGPGSGTGRIKAHILREPGGAGCRRASSALAAGERNSSALREVRGIGDYAERMAKGRIKKAVYTLGGAGTG